MSLTFTIQFNVPSLSDQSVWFANAQAWKNYWDSADVGTVTFSPIETTIYTVVPFVPQDAIVLDIDGIQWSVPQKSAFDSLVAKVASMDAALQTMRQQLKDAGLITEAQ